ncbi:hypothetical protein J6590_070001 [Homalodisca vitripennis]|nr:hypothetical protein J6590_070001 [Homalodisca vitripennis]
MLTIAPVLSVYEMLHRPLDKEIESLEHHVPLKESRDTVVEMLHRPLDKEIESLEHHVPLKESRDTVRLQCFTHVDNCSCNVSLRDAVLATG